jgi:phospholipid/cholesterol/gamma-HCH transport system permease protein
MDSGKQGFKGFLERVGQGSIRGIEEIGGCAALFGESLYWVVVGRRFRQPVRIESIFVQMMEVGIQAIPIVLLLAGTIGVMIAIQGIHTLRIFGAESRVVVGIALSVTREFAPLITGILIAGRSGSALAARLGTMTINQEVDALTVMGINPVRYLVAPALLALVVMLPALTFFSDVVGLFAAGLYVSADLGLSLAAYLDQTLQIVKVGDLTHGLGKSVIFGVLIALIGVANGAAVKGGAEGVGKATTRAVVQSISAIVFTDMVFVFVVTR